MTKRSAVLRILPLPTGGKLLTKCANLQIGKGITLCIFLTKHLSIEFSVYSITLLQATRTTGLQTTIIAGTRDETLLL